MAELAQALGQIFVVLILLGLGYGFGHYREAAHFRYLADMEQRLRGISLTNVQALAYRRGVKAVGLVSGSVVIATDYFKVFATGLRNLFGGEIRSLVTLIERARREACVRMLTEAQALGANAVVNLRYETATISGQQKKQTGGVEVIAYGTALIVPPDEGRP